jgi:hypothetical protein
MAAAQKPRKVSYLGRLLGLSFGVVDGGTAAEWLLETGLVESQS